MLKELQTRHREIARLKHQGLRTVEIAERLGISDTTIRCIMCDPIFKAHLNGLEDASDRATIDARKILADGAIRAAERIVELIEVPDEKVSLQASKDVLDRTGYAAQTANFHAHIHMNTDEIERLKDRARQLGIVAPKSEEPSDERDLTTYEVTPQ